MSRPRPIVPRSLPESDQAHGAVTLLVTGLVSALKSVRGLCLASGAVSVVLLQPACSPRSTASEDPGGPGDDVAQTQPSKPASNPTPSASTPLAANPKADAPAPAPDAILPVPPLTKSSLREHPAGRAWVFEAGKAPVSMALPQAEARGLTIIDLSDDWVPYIFTDKTPGQENGSRNRYAKRYRDLANDRTDADGDRLPSYRQNFLELYGIPPALSVISAEFARVSGEDQRCLDEAGYAPEVFRDRARPIAFRKKSGPRRLSKHRSARKRLNKLMRKAKIDRDDLAAAAENPRTREAYAKWKRLDDEVEIIRQAQIRFRCERLFPTRRGLGNFKPGNFDGQVHMALAAFEKKHNIRGWGHFTNKNLAALGMTAIESTHARLLRSLRERVISGAGIVEDGSAIESNAGFTWTDENGQSHNLRNLAGEFSQAFVDALGLGDAATAADRLAEIGKLSDKGFGQLLVAVRLPEKPAYYSEDMAFDVIIDRGDVWYDFIYDDEGNKKSQPRKRFPHFKLFTVYRDQKIPLLDWRTTIGSWRSEEHEGHEWLAYKNSDIGKRVWKNIVAAPTWIPPMSTPTRGLVKYKIRNGKRVRVVNYDETGPSYTSAYGLVAAYHIRQIRNAEGEVIREHDNQIRTHGSVDYMSIMRRYSHGCHRLYNMNAVELFSFILQHRTYEREGQVRIGYKREFEYEEQDFMMELDSRGYRYTLSTPINVEVLEGRIRGKRKRPYTELIEKPGVDYTEDEFEEGTGGEIPGEGTGGEIPGEGLGGTNDPNDPAGAVDSGAVGGEPGNPGATPNQGSNDPQAGHAAGTPEGSRVHAQQPTRAPVVPSASAKSPATSPSAPANRGLGNTRRSRAAERSAARAERRKARRQRRE